MPLAKKKISSSKNELFHFQNFAPYMYVRQFQGLFVCLIAVGHLNCIVTIAGITRLGEVQQLIGHSPHLINFAAAKRGCTLVSQSQLMLTLSTGARRSFPGNTRLELSTLEKPSTFKILAQLRAMFFRNHTLCGELCQKILILS